MRCMCVCARAQELWTEWDSSAKYHSIIFPISEPQELHNLKRIFTFRDQSQRIYSEGF